MKKKNCDAYVGVLPGGRMVLKCACGFEVTKKTDIGALTFKKDEIMYVRYTGAGGIYDIINDANEQERIGPEEMTALIQDGTIVPHLM